MNTMNANQIFDLVKDWPREAWPVPVESSVEIEYLFNNRNDLDAAEIMCLSCAFVGSGLAWLAERDCLPALGCGGGWSIHTRGGACYATQLAHPLAAVSAAVLAAAKEGA